MSRAPGDEVVCVDASPGVCGRLLLTEGRTYTISRVWDAPEDFDAFGEYGVDLVEAPFRATEKSDGYRASRFRKVDRKRDLKALLLGEPIDFEEPKRVLKPKREAA